MYVWKHYNPNPKKRNTGDCSVRAIAKALDVDWETAYSMLVVTGFILGDMPSSNSVWGSVLHQHGFYKKAIPNSCPECYTVADFAIDNPHGVFVLGTGTHAVTVIDGIIYDAWESSNEIPAYYWYRRE